MNWTIARERCRACGSEGDYALPLARLNRVWTFGAWGATTWSGQYAFGGRLAATW